MANNDRIGSGEAIPPGFESVPHSELYKKLHERLAIKVQMAQYAVDSSRHSRDVEVVSGFEDILNNRALGSGIYSNTWATVPQLLFALSIAPNLRIREIIEDMTISYDDIIRKFKDEQVLSGMKILDLGSGTEAHFARVAKSLGATVYTADIQKSQKVVLDAGIQHIQMNLKGRPKGQRPVNFLLSQTGGDFDLVSEGMLGVYPYQRTTLPPFRKHIFILASALLKPGGYVHSHIMTDDEGFKKKSFRKK